MGVIRSGVFMFVLFNPSFRYGSPVLCVLRAGLFVTLGTAASECGE